MEKTNNKYDKTKSRKWKLVLLVLLITTFGTFVPPVAAMFLNCKELKILDGSHFVALVSLVVSAYFGINVWQKKIEKNNTKEE